MVRVLLSVIRLLHFLTTIPKVTFSDEVTIYEPNKKTHVIAGDHLNDYDYLINVADKLNIQVNESVSKSKEKLFDILRSLEERGATALGPALLVSISIAGRSKGSSVILCTDGTQIAIVYVNLLLTYWITKVWPTLD
mgnify:CR=1 FL=1